MVKTTKLAETLKAEGYELTMQNRPSYDYNVRKGNKKIGRIRVYMKDVQAYIGTEVLCVPYDIDIDVVDGSADMPIDLFKKMIMATVTIF